MTIPVGIGEGIAYTLLCVALGAFLSLAIFGDARAPIAPHKPTSAPRGPDAAPVATGRVLGVALVEDSGRCRAFIPVRHGDHFAMTAALDRWAGIAAADRSQLRVVADAGPATEGGRDV